MAIFVLKRDVKLQLTNELSLICQNLKRSCDLKRMVVNLIYSMEPLQEGDEKK